MIYLDFKELELMILYFYILSTIFIIYTIYNFVKLKSDIIEQLQSNAALLKAFTNLTKERHSILQNLIDKYFENSNIVNDKDFVNQFMEQYKTFQHFFEYVDKHLANNTKLNIFFKEVHSKINK